jgi:U3 small nucleolar RNA-associated protein 14
MTVLRKTKKSGKSERPVLNLDSDLLGFVNALEELDDLDGENAAYETHADLDREESREKISKKSKKKVTKMSSLGDADLDDFASVLDGDDASFAGLKKRMSILGSRKDFGDVGEEDEEAGGSRRKKNRVKTVDAPLPTAQQKQIDRSVAYEKSVKDVSKWTGIIQKNRDSEQLSFPLIQQQGSANVSSHTMISTFEPSTDLEKEIAGLIKRDGIVPLAANTEEASDELPTNHLDAEQVSKELSKIRSSKFFAEIKSRRQAKIKSKKYRKMLGKERMKAEAEAIASGNLSELGRLGLLSGSSEDSEVRRERRLKAEMDRARERLTLRTRKVNKWAQELLNKRHGDADGRLKVLEQVREKERLRQEIYGLHDSLSNDEDDDEEDSDSEESSEDDFEKNSNEEDGNEIEEHDIVDDYEVQEIFDRVKEENTVKTGRFKFTGNDGESVINVEEASDDENLNREISHSIVRKSATSTSKASKGISVNDEFSDDESSHWQTQKNLIREAFAEDEVFTDFAAEKGSIVDAEAPKSVDVTLPGWGMWAGADIAPEDSVPRDKKFVIHRKGLDPRARLDKDLKHVIINERRIKSAARAFTIPKTPFPFTSSEMHSRHISQPIGKEWNTVTSFKKRIQPKIVAKAGSIIKPIKFFKQNKHI